MPRLRQVPRSEADPFAVACYDYVFGEGRDPVADPGSPTGSVGDWWTTFALVPDVLRHAVSGFELYRSPARRLDPRLRELAMTRVGWACASQFVFSQHCKSCREVGVTEAQLAAIASWSIADCFSPLERAVLAYADALAYDHGRVAEEVVERLRSALSDEGVLELTYLTSLYVMHASMTRALRCESDDRDEPVVEVPAPAAP